MIRVHEAKVHWPQRLRMVGYERQDLVSGRLRWTDMTPAHYGGRDLEELVAELQRAGSLQPFEWEYFRTDGGPASPVSVD